MEIDKKEMCEYDLLKPNIVFVDGLTRVGKAMYNRILASLSSITHPQFLVPLEQLLPMYKTGHIDINAFSTFMRLHLNERAYDYKLSRNLNFRYDDLTSVHNSTNVKEFFRNLSKEDGDLIIDVLDSDNTIHQFQTHDILTHYSLFLDLKIDVKIIEIFRSPIDTVHSWYKRGWGRRFEQEDPRSFTTLFKYKERTIPHYAIGHEDIYLNLNEMEKCLFLHNILLKESVEEYKKLSEKQKKLILIVQYEDMLKNPIEEIEKITNFINVSATEYTKQAMKEARVPRNIEKNTKDIKLKDIQNNVSKELFRDLIALEKEYINNLYGLGL